MFSIMRRLAVLILLALTIAGLLAPASANYLNGHSLTQTLDARQKPYVLKTAKASAPSSTALWLTYGYNARGRVSSVLDSDGAGVLDNRSYVYDKLGRLDAATGPFGASGAQSSADYNYDALSNIRTRNEGTSTASIAYASGNRVTSATVNGATRSFAYDWRGNVTSNGPTGFTYDFANQPTSIAGAGAATFVYDGNLKRVKEVRAGKTIYTIYSKLTGGLIYRDQATDAIRTDYSSDGGAALRLKKTGTGAFVPEYTHFDAQGSAVAATDANGAVAWREVYAPFGEERLNPAANDNNTGFTGHLKDDASGLTYMQARYYDPLIGRFLSTDPIGYQDQLNLYAYVHNDPVNATDPTGKDTVRNETDDDLIVRGNPPKEGDASGGGAQMYGVVPPDGEVYGGEDNPIPAYDSKAGAETAAEAPYVAQPPTGEIQDVDGYFDPSTGENVRIRGDSEGPETTVGQDKNGNTTQSREGVPGAYRREIQRSMGLERERAPNDENSDGGGW